MLTIKRKRYGVNIQEVYFPAGDWPLLDCDLRVAFCQQQPEQYSCTIQTALIALQQESEQILGGFRKSYRREIRSNEFNNEFVLTFSRAPRPQDIHAFSAAYDGFARQQKLPPCNLNKLLYFAGQDSLILSQIRCSHSGQVLCRHAFIGDGERARLLYSLSGFRLYQLNSFQRNRIGRAHRLLHWADMQQFKQSDYRWYDLGGIAKSTDSQLQNINYFKRGFGGEVCEEYVNFTPMTIKGWVAMHYLKRRL